MRNDYLDYYGEHNISPVNQDISDFDLHLRKRLKLYHQCGLSNRTFINADVLEVGPGGGENSLCLYELGVNHVDLVEPNPQGVQNLRNLYGKYKLNSNSYTIFDSSIEEYRTNKKYDIIVAEGFIQYLDNKEFIIDKLKSFARPSTIILITCADDACIFIDLIKRIVSNYLVKDVKEYNKKVEILTDFFAPQLSNLTGMSRNAKQWVQDNILNPAVTNENELSLIDAMDFFGEDYVVMGTSPSIFTDWSWYKDIQYNVKESWKEQYNKKILSFLIAGSGEIVIAGNDEIGPIFSDIRVNTKEYEKDNNVVHLNNIINDISRIIDICGDIDEIIAELFSETIQVLSNIISGEEFNFAGFDVLYNSFGRTQHYIAFEKI